MLDNIATEAVELVLLQTKLSNWLKKYIFCKYAIGCFSALELKLINLQFLLHREHSVLIIQTK